MAGFDDHEVENHHYRDEKDDQHAWGVLGRWLVA